MSFVGLGHQWLVAMTQTTPKQGIVVIQYRLGVLRILAPIDKFGFELFGMFFLCPMAILSSLRGSLGRLVEEADDMVQKKLA
jgi:hypothetical protein